MALPKRRHSPTRRNKRRSHYRLSLPHLSVCPKCNEPRLPHRACPACGFYKGRLVVPAAAE
ncbi:MAG: 50S ribosomal protein L32 [Desulfobaccales bacterium]|jgi:large subunit ribosomal protein L32